MTVASGILVSMRPSQWTKNLVVFAALVFSKSFMEIENIEMSLILFAIFCLSSYAVYLINDVIDVDRDKLHPEKRERPIASGIVSKRTAIAIAFVLIIVSLTIALLVLNISTFIAVTAFFVLNLLYSSILKNIVIFDVMSIAGSFVIRAVAGGLAISVPISSWLIVCTILLALFMGFGKRRHELRSLDQAAVEHRKSLEHYSTYFLDQMISVVTASTVVTYTFYTLSSDVKEKLDVQHLELSIPFVLYGVFRYLYLIHRQERGGSPSRILLTDIPILVTVILWLVTVVVLMSI